MTDDDLAQNRPRPRQAQAAPRQKTGGKSAALAAALRANLQRRKASQRATAAEAGETAQPGAPAREPDVGEKTE